MAMMTSTKDLSSHIADITECSICMRSFKNPKVLPCIHSFCLQCLKRYSQDKNPGDQVNCPLCRKLFVLPTGGVNELPNNYFIDKLMLSLTFPNFARNESEVGNVKCDLCAKSAYVPAAVYCVECDQHLCMVCCSRHKRSSAWRDHHIGHVNFKNKPSARELMEMTPTYCEQHPTKELDFYCYECHTTACTVCFFSEHKSHRCCDIKESGEGFSEQLNDDIKKVAPCAIECQERIKQLKTERINFIASVETVQEDIGRKYKEFLLPTTTGPPVDQVPNQFFEVLNAFKDNHLKGFQMRIEEAERQFVIIESFNRYAEEIKEKATACEISRAGYDLHNRAEELLKSQVDFWRTQLSAVSITFRPSLKITDLGEKNFIGDLSFKISASGRLEEDNFRATSFLQPLTAIHKINCKVNKVRGLAVLGRELYVASQLPSSPIEVYDTKTFALLRELSIPGLSTMRGLRSLVACPYNGCIYTATADTNAMLYRVEVAKNSTSQWNLKGECYGLSVTADKNVLATIYNTQRILEYTTHGELIREITDKNVDVSGFFPSHCAQLSTGNFVMSCIGKMHSISIIDSSGHIHQTYSGPNKMGADELNYPYQLAVDKFDNILVANCYNGRVQVLSPTLTHLGNVQTVGHNLHGPYAVHLDEINSVLYIGERDSGCVVVIRSDE